MLSAGALKSTLTFLTNWARPGVSALIRFIDNSIDRPVARYWLNSRAILFAACHFLHHRSYLMRQN